MPLRFTHRVLEHLGHANYRPSPVRQVRRDLRIETEDREVFKEAIEQLRAKGVSANHLPIKWIVPLFPGAVTEILSRSKRNIVVENNYSGQFYRYLRSETGLTINNHIRKYDGEPFMPHHIVNGVLELLAGKTDRYIPDQEIMV